MEHHIVCLSVCLSVRLSVCLSVCLSVRSSVCLSARLSVRLFVRPSVCLSATKSKVIISFSELSSKIFCQDQHTDGPTDRRFTAGCSYLPSKTNVPFISRPTKQSLTILLAHFHLLNKLCQSPYHQISSLGQAPLFEISNNWSIFTESNMAVLTLHATSTTCTVCPTKIKLPQISYVLHRK